MASLLVSKTTGKPNSILLPGSLRGCNGNRGSLRHCGWADRKGGRVHGSGHEAAETDSEQQASWLPNTWVHGRGHEAVKKKGVEQQASWLPNTPKQSARNNSPTGKSQTS